MRVRIASLVCLALAVGCARPLPWDAASLAELQRRVRQDQSLRDTVFSFFRHGGAGPDTMLIRHLQRQDSANGAWLKGMLQRRPWPGRAEAGPEAAQGAFLVVQHTRNDTAFQSAALRLVQAAHARHDVDGQDLALLTDELLLDRGQRQRYGTKAQIVHGQLVLDSLEDSAHVDARRSALGLMPLGAYLRFLDSLYGLGNGPRPAPQ